jgi:dehydrogenase/reductase SDR family protein 1
MEKTLQGKVAVITGASRGVGKGIALALADEGLTLFLTGRKKVSSERGLGGSLEETAASVEERGGKAIIHHCDHAVDGEVRALFERVKEEFGTLDLLVNNVYALAPKPFFGVPFWEQSLETWDRQERVGLRSHYVASVYAAPMMVAQKRGLIANISSYGGGVFALNVAYGVLKAGVDRLAKDMAHDLRPHGVSAISLWPGVVRTERIVKYSETLPFDMEVTESAEYTGRAIAALMRDPDLGKKNGKRLIVAELAQEYGFTDVDGTQPPSLRASTTRRD